MAAGDMATPAKFKAAVINAFGAKNKLGISSTFPWCRICPLGIRLMQRIEVPCWRDESAIVAWYHLLPNVEYGLPAHIPALVYDGDLDNARQLYRRHEDQ